MQLEGENRAVVAFSFIALRLQPPAFDTHKHPVVICEAISLSALRVLLTVGPTLFEAVALGTRPWWTNTSS